MKCRLTQRTEFVASRECSVDREIHLTKRATPACVNPLSWAQKPASKIRGKHSRTPRAKFRFLFRQRMDERGEWRTRLYWKKVTTLLVPKRRNIHSYDNGTYLWLLANVPQTTSWRLRRSLDDASCYLRQFTLAFWNSCMPLSINITNLLSFRSVLFVCTLRTSRFCQVQLILKTSFLLQS